MDKIFRALADRNRRMILTLIKDRALSVNEIVTNLPVGQATVSSHLAILSKAKLVQCEARGKSRFYKMDMEVWNQLVGHLDKFRVRIENLIPNEIIIRRK